MEVTCRVDHDYVSWVEINHGGDAGQRDLPAAGSMANPSSAGPRRPGFGVFIFTSHQPAPAREANMIGTQSVPGAVR